MTLPSTKYDDSASPPSQGPQPGTMALRTACLERWLPSVELSVDGCWPSTAYVEKSGYARVGWNGKNVLLHRVFYEVFVGPIPEGMVLDHLCRVRHCVRPDHLEPVTFRLNVLRGAANAAVNARKTHCVRGHELTDDNCYPRQLEKGWRVCRLCVKEKWANR